MKKRNLLFAVLVGVLAVSMVSCVGVQYAEMKTMSDGTKIIQGGRTGVFGHDNSFVHIQQSAPPPVPMFLTPPAPVAQAPTIVTPVQPAPQQQPKKVLVERSYSRSSTSWTGCSDKTPNKRAKNIQRKEEGEKWTEEVVVPVQIIPPRVVVFQPQPTVMVPQPAPQPVFYGGGNSSTGNAALGSLFIAGGMVGGAALLRPAETRINQSQTGGGATAYGGQGGGGGGATAYGGQGGGGGGGGEGGNALGIGTGGSASSSASSSAASSASAAAAAAAGN